jgi:hypothetical protein
VPSHERVHELRLAPGRDRRERGEEVAKRAEASRRVRRRVRGALGGKRAGERRGGGGGGERGGERAREKTNAWASPRGGVPGISGSRARVRVATPRTALSIDTTLVVYRCRSASVRSMAPSRRRCNPRQRRLLPGPAPTVAQDE